MTMSCDRGGERSVNQFVPRRCRGVRDFCFGAVVAHNLAQREARVVFVPRSEDE